MEMVGTEKVCPLMVGTEKVCPLHGDGRNGEGVMTEVQPFPVTEVHHTHQAMQTVFRWEQAATVFRWEQGFADSAKPWYTHLLQQACDALAPLALHPVHE